MKLRRRTMALGLSLALGLAGSGMVAAQGTAPGMMPGMMSGQGMGPGMMSGQGIGPGMMSGQGIGPGMMSGQGIGPGMMIPCPMMGEPPMPQLNDEQHLQLRELRQAYRPAQFERMARLMNLNDDLMTEMQGERPDPEAVQALHGQMAEVHGEMLAERVRLRNAMHELLTDEQRQQMRGALPGVVGPDDHDTHQ